VIKKILPLVFLGLTAVGFLVIGALGFNWFSTARKPEQPIAFSHRVHIEKVGLDCNRCHYYADKSIHAGIPAVKVCMDCHEKVATDRPEVKKLLKYWQDKEPIPWLKVHNLAWHVHFTHKRHIKADIQCARCHGELKAMDTARKVGSLNMGWCVSCHRQNHAPTDCLTCHK